MWSNFPDIIIDGGAVNKRSAGLCGLRSDPNRKTCRLVERLGQKNNSIPRIRV